jgi:hypothetical protein
MKLHRKRTEPPAEAPADAPANSLDALTGGHLGDEDARPTREDRQYGQTIFTRPPVKVPKLLKGRRERERDGH